MRVRFALAAAALLMSSAIGCNHLNPWHQNESTEVWSDSGTTWTDEGTVAGPVQGPTVEEEPQQE